MDNTVFIIKHINGEVYGAGETYSACKKWLKKNNLNEGLFTIECVEVEKEL